MFPSNYFTCVSLIVSLVILINLTGQLCQLVDSPLLMESSSSQSSSSSSDSSVIVGDLSSSSSPSSIDNSYENEDTKQLDGAHHGSKKKRYQPARYLVRPFWLNPKYTWKAFQMNSSRNEAKDAEIRKLREKKLTKIRKLADKINKASLISKKLFLLLHDITLNLDPQSI